MYAVVGIVILIVMVFGGFAITGGALGPVMEAIPHEMLIIMGAAAGAIVTGNNMHGIKAFLGGFGKVFKGPKHTRQDHIDAIILTTKLMKLLRAEGPVALESHVTEPQNSAIFAEFPRLLANKALTALICDTLTLIVVSSGTRRVEIDTAAAFLGNRFLLARLNSDSEQNGPVVDSRARQLVADVEPSAARDVDAFARSAASDHPPRESRTDSRPSPMIFSNRLSVL